MHANDFLAQIGQGPLSPVVLLCPGKAPFNKEPYEPMLADQVMNKVVENYVDPSLSDLVYSTFYADETQPGEIAREAETLPFLAERRVIVVRNCERYMKMGGERRSPLAPLLAYLEKPAETTILLLITSQADKRKKFYKAAQKGGVIVECPQLDDKELSRWIRDEAAKHGKAIASAAVGEIIHRGGSRLGDIKNAVNLVATYVGNEEQIREQDVIAACADVAEETVWALTDAIAASNPDRALHVLYQLLDLNKSPDEIMGIINWLMESAYRAAPQSGASLQSRFLEGKVMPLVQKLGLPRLKRGCALCTDTHFMIRNTGVDKMLALELLVIKLSVPSRRRPAPRRA